MRIITAVLLVCGLLAGWLLGSVFPMPGTAWLRRNARQASTMDASNKIEAALDVMENDWFFGKDIENLDARLRDQALLGIFSNEEDPHTEYMTAEEVSEFRQSIDRNFVGIGVEFISNSGINMVTKVFRGAPAFEAGVQPGDVIEAIDGVSTEGMTSADIKERVQGEKGTDVTISFRRQGGPVDITITRDEISATAHGFILDENTGYLQLYQFGTGTAQEIDRYLSEFRDADIHKLVIDLRDNGGGYLDALAQVASRFLPGGTLCMKQVYPDGTEESVYAASGFLQDYFGIVILINENSASAAEVFTLAMKEQRKDVTIVGTTSYGKGTVQITQSFNDGSALKFTTSKWISPNEVWVNQVGIEPDETVNLHDVLNRTFGGLEEGQILQKDQVSEAIKDVQLSLDYLGYAPGRTDGYFSEGTAAALSAFCQAYELSDNGTIDETIYKALFSAVRRDWSLSHTHDVQLHRAQEVLHG
jgi:carboxyl-terminal processing protease